MRTMLLAAATVLTLNAGIALADSGDSFDYNRSLDTQTNSSQVVRSAQSQITVPNDAQATVIAHSVSQSQDVRADAINYPISWAAANRSWSPSTKEAGIMPASLLSAVTSFPVHQVSCIA